MVFLRVTELECEGCIAIPITTRIPPKAFWSRGILVSKSVFKESVEKPRQMLIFFRFDKDLSTRDILPRHQLKLEIASNLDRAELMSTSIYENWKRACS